MTPSQAHDSAWEREPKHDEMTVACRDWIEQNWEERTFSLSEYRDDPKAHELEGSTISRMGAGSPTSWPIGDARIRTSGSSLANSYSFSAMNACMATERALEVLRDALEAWFSGREDEPRGEELEFSYARAFWKDGTATQTSLPLT
jgi:hypothetical protein